MNARGLGRRVKIREAVEEADFLADPVDANPKRNVWPIAKKILMNAKNLALLMMMEAMVEMMAISVVVRKNAELFAKQIQIFLLTFVTVFGHRLEADFHRFRRLAVLLKAEAMWHVRT